MTYQEQFEKETGYDLKDVAKRSKVPIEFAHYIVRLETKLQEAEKKFVSFMEGLEMQNIDEFIKKDHQEIFEFGKVMAIRIKNLQAKLQKAEKVSQELAKKYAVVFGRCMKSEYELAVLKAKIECPKEGCEHWYNNNCGLHDKACIKYKHLDQFKPKEDK